MNIFLNNLDSWEKYSKTNFSKQFNGISTVLREKILPSFEDLEKEAETISNQAYLELISQPSDGESDGDLSDFAEKAVEEGVEHFQFYDDAKQSYLNITAAALFHLFEQQASSLLRMFGSEEYKDLHKLADDLNSRGIDIRVFQSWDKLKELKDLCNTVKHGDGRSSESLKKKRRDLFIHPRLRNGDYEDDFLTAESPLSGRDIYVSIADINEYQIILDQFWDEFLTSCNNLKNELSEQNS